MRRVNLTERKGRICLRFASPVYHPPGRLSRRHHGRYCCHLWVKAPTEEEMDLHLLRPVLDHPTSYCLNSAAYSLTDPGIPAEIFRNPTEPSLPQSGSLELSPARKEAPVRFRLPVKCGTNWRPLTSSSAHLVYLLNFIPCVVRARASP
uniref:Uncharacterized protein n=1 Tax=Sphaerodactylus townsendi TaxID=933632 RepID=A0ACB8EBU2_9SAUR